MDEPVSDADASVRDEPDDAVELVFAGLLDAESPDERLSGERRFGERFDEGPDEATAPDEVQALSTAAEATAASRPPAIRRTRWHTNSADDDTIPPVESPKKE